MVVDGIVGVGIYAQGILLLIARASEFQPTATVKLQQLSEPSQQPY